MAYSLTACLLAFSAGVSAHLGIFIKDDWDRHAVTLFHVFIAAPVLGFGLAIFLVDWSYLLQAAASLLSFDSGLCLSILTYRYFFHALGRFPGPRRACLSSIWAVPDAVIKAQWHLRVNRLHSEYGDFVRIKPNEISVNNPGALKDIHDIHTKCTKGPFYDVREYAPIARLLLWAPWVMILARNLPILERQTASLMEWYTQYIEERKKQADLSHDLLGYFIQDSLSGSSHAGKGTDQDLVFDTELAVVAGSDTTATTLSCALFFLAKNPDIVKELRGEIDAAVRGGKPLSHSALLGCQYLEGCINESLRLCPPTPSGLPRETGSQGAIIAGTYIPPRSTVSVPVYTVHRDPRNFQDPEQFIPKRWSSRPDLIIRREAFVPFSIGPYSCVGKPFAMMELRLLLATIVKNFNLEFPPGDEPESLDRIGATGPQDCFVARIPSFHLIFKARAKD
ncbi:cytochrome P450 [Aspergillus germanicus]